MARVFITGSSDGLGRMAAELLIEQRHSVVLHARNQKRGKDAMAAVPQAETVVIGDLTSIAQTRGVAEQVNKLGVFDAVIHNAGVGYREPRRIATEDGLPHVFAVNTLAPYILTALMQRPKRLVYLSSGLHRNGDASLKDLAWKERPWQGSRLTRIRSCMMCFWRSPWRGAGRVFFRMLWNRVGSPQKWEALRRTDNLDEGHRTQVWLAVSEDAAAKVTGEYFYHMRKRSPKAASREPERQQMLLEACARFSGIAMPD